MYNSRIRDCMHLNEARAVGSSLCQWHVSREREKAKRPGEPADGLDVPRRQTEILANALNDLFGRIASCLACDRMLDPRARWFLRRPTHAKVAFCRRRHHFLWVDPFGSKPIQHHPRESEPRPRRLVRKAHATLTNHFFTSILVARGAAGPAMQIIKIRNRFPTSPLRGWLRQNILKETEERTENQLLDFFDTKT